MTKNTVGAFRLLYIPWFCARSCDGACFVTCTFRIHIEPKAKSSKWNMGVISSKHLAHGCVFCHSWVVDSQPLTVRPTFVCKQYLCVKYWMFIKRNTYFDNVLSCLDPLWSNCIKYIENCNFVVHKLCFKRRTIATFGKMTREMCRFSPQQ